ncbi:hypothetical protein SeseC_00734 [Streptococcus equi subsp. zooepidemicus ATCC 35246]|nr:hypothetical protein SeseC_00734 [Streptococcus equi subsp. zooepidemicus ATCC 35246]
MTVEQTLYLRIGFLIVLSFDDSIITFSKFFPKEEFSMAADDEK